MKLRIISDIHREHGIDFELPITEQDKENILVIAGDLDVGVHSLNFLQKYSPCFRYIIYVFGNHEYYHNYHEFLPHNLQILLNDLKLGNIHIASTGSVFNLGEQKFICGTMWGDVKKEDVAKSIHNINDYRLIKQLNGDTLTPKVTNIEHKRFIRLLKDNLDSDTIVITHHAPSKKCISPEFMDSEFNYLFVTDLDYLMEKYKPKLWIHGHCHHTVDIKIDKTRVLSNPYGYVTIDKNTEFDSELEVEI
jgi:predicted phosphodiesterase